MQCAMDNLCKEKREGACRAHREESWYNEDGDVDVLEKKKKN